MPVSKKREKMRIQEMLCFSLGYTYQDMSKDTLAQTGLINRGVKQMTNLLIIEIYRTILINKDCWE